MIEELKMVLDSIGDLTGVALWVVGFFIVFKLVVYLSTTGAVVFLVKMLIEKLHSYGTMKKEPDNVFHSWNYADDICISCDDTRKMIERVLDRVKGKNISIESKYIHRESAQWLLDAVNEKEQREAQNDSH